MGHLRILLLSLLLLPWARLVAGEKPATILESLPAQLAGCEREKVHDYDQPGLGASVAYKKPGFLCTVYIYDLEQPNIGESLTDPVLQKAYEGARAELKEAVKQGYYSNLEELDHGTVALKSGEKVLQARYRLTREKGRDAGLRVYSEIDVFGARHQIAKLRISASVDNETEHLKTIEQLAPAVLAALREGKSK